MAPGSTALIGHARRYRLLVCAVLVALTLPRMTARSMFGDGMLYAVIARNMSLGIGSLWSPSFSATAYPEFFDSPPLGLALQGAAFWILGDHLFVERVFSLAAFAIQALLIMAIWRQLLPRSHDWLPLLFWVTPSIVTWTVVNNMLENVQTVFTTAAVYLLIRGMKDARTARVLQWSGSAGLLVAAAVLTKGPVGLFPLAVPVLALLLPLEDRPARPVLMMGTLIGVVASTALALVAYHPAHRALTEYVRIQLLPALAGRREISNDPWAAARHLGLGIITRMAVLLLIARVAGRARAQVGSYHVAIFLFAVALAGSLPIAISPKMTGHYFLPSVPMYALAFAVAALPFLRSAAAWFEPSRWGRFLPAALASALIVAAIAVPLVHGPIQVREPALLASLDAVRQNMPRGLTIGTCTASDTDWGFRTYLQRFFRISLDATDRPANGWFVSADDACAAPVSCAPVARAPQLALFECRPSGAR